MGSASGSGLPLLMVLRVKGRATPATVAAATGMSVGEADAALVAGERDGLARSCASGGEWALTERGRGALAERLAAEPIDRAALAALYERFLATDGRLKTGITAWQLARRDPRDRTAGTETDASLASIAAAATALVRELARLVPRLAGYAARLEAAGVAIAAGDHRFVASPRVDSLHQVWFELHEDLLVTLGRRRTS